MVSFYEGFNLASQLYAIPAVIIYIVFLYILFKKRSNIYNSIFYDYIRLLGIVDLCVYFLFYGAFRAGHFSVLYPVYECFLFDNWFITIWVYLTSIFQHAQHFIHLFISINRLCAFILPIKIQQYWKYIYKVTSILVFIAPSIYMGWLLWAKSSIQFYSVPRDMPVWYGMDNNKPWEYNTVWPSKGKIFAAVGGTCYLLCFIFNMITVAKLTILKSKNYRKQSADVKLFTISILLFVAAVIHCVFYLFLTLNNGSSSEIVYYFYTPFQCFTYDLATLSTPFCFMILSKNLRKNIYQIVTLKSEGFTITNPLTKNWM